MEHAVALLHECIDLAAEAGNRCFDAENRTEIQGLGGMFLARAAQSLASAGLLAQHGLIGDAMSCGRTVVEMAIDFAYIAHDTAQRDTRMERFQAYDDQQRFRIATGVNNHGGAVPQQHLQALETRAAQFRANNPGDRSNWAGRNLRERATEARRLALYEMPYCEMCNASHSGYGTLQYAFVWSEGNPSTPSVRFGSMAPNAHPIAVTVGAMLVLIGDVVDACALDVGISERSNVLANKLPSLV